MMNACRTWTTGVFLAMTGSAAVRAQDAPVGSKSEYTVLNPTPRAQMREMTMDRPDGTESPYTVDAGHLQVELSFADWTYEEDGPVEAWALRVAPMLIKVGLTNDIDLQLGLEPYIYVEVDNDASGNDDSVDGFGDTSLRLKYNVWGNDGGETAFALVPFLTFPTAEEGLGADEVEGGVHAPFSMDLGDGFWLGLMAGLDFPYDPADDDYLVDFLHTAELAKDLNDAFTVYVEYVGIQDLSDSDSDYYARFDAGATYATSEDVLWDTGLRIGLTDAAEDLGAFAGVSVRF